VFTIDVEAPTVTFTSFEDMVTPRMATTVTCSATDDIGIRSVTLHVQGEDGERSYLMQLVEDDTWSFDYVPEEGDFAMYATASDGAYTTRSVVVDVDVTTASAEGTGASSLVMALATAAVAAFLVTAVVFVLIRRRS
jgi:hypothetical protein